jgi:branched-chain amino acid transport system ATP-binding protein
MLKLERLAVAYGPVQAVRGLTMHVNAGEVVALVGANGAGKSSTLKALLGLAPDTGGAIVFNGRELRGLPSHQRVAQGLALSPEGRHVFPDMSVLENLHSGFLDGSRKLAERNARVDEMFARFPRLAERHAQAAGTLSGGEQQMLAIGRALMSRPKLLMLDEPTLGLAPVIVDQIAELIVSLRASGMAVLIAEQNVEMTLQISDRAYVMDCGELVKQGASTDLARDPAIRRAYLGI